MTQEDVKSGVNLRTHADEGRIKKEDGGVSQDILSKIAQTLHLNYKIFNLRNGDLRGGVVLEAEGVTLQHLEAKALTLVSIYTHRCDSNGQLARILHLEALVDGEEGLVGAQTYKVTHDNIEAFVKGIYCRTSRQYLSF